MAVHLLVTRIRSERRTPPVKVLVGGGWWNDGA